MPTGYTADVGDGTLTDFRTFALRCARNFGACIMQRDDPLTDLPKILEPSDYHLKNKIQAIEKLEQLNAMSREEIAAKCLHDYESRVQERNREISRRQQIEQRYRAMLAEVEAWTPPTPDHENMKNFMRDQLNESIRFDCSIDYWAKEPKLLSVDEWLFAQRENIKHDIEYHATNYANEVERANSRAQWVRDLYASLDPVTA